MMSSYCFFFPLVTSPLILRAVIFPLWKLPRTWTVRCQPGRWCCETSCDFRRVQIVLWNSAVWGGRRTRVTRVQGLWGEIYNFLWISSKTSSKTSSNQWDFRVFNYFWRFCCCSKSQDEHFYIAPASQELRRSTTSCSEAVPHATLSTGVKMKALDLTIWQRRNTIKLNWLVYLTCFEKQNAIGTLFMGLLMVIWVGGNLNGVHYNWYHIRLRFSWRASFRRSSGGWNMNDVKRSYEPTDLDRRADSSERSRLTPCWPRFGVLRLGDVDLYDNISTNRHIHWDRSIGQSCDAAWHEWMRSQSTNIWLS